MNNFRRQRLALLFASVLVARLCVGQSSETPAKSPILGLVDGQTISEDDLPPQVQGQLKPLREQEYRIRKQALDALINQKLVEAEAKKKGISPDTLLQQEVESKLAEPTEAELRAVYAVQRDQLNQQPFEDVKAQLQQTLKKAKLQEAAQEYVTSLRGQAKILILLAAPQTLVSFDPARVRGNAKARVMIVEFADSQCPYCRQVQMTLKDILAKHEGVVALAFRDMPLEKIHPLALNAAEAARCAGEQGKFWEYYDLLYADPASLNKDGLIANAAKLSLDGKQFSACLADEKYKGQIEQDSQDGMRAGGSGTPSFFINGIFLSGAQPESAFEKIIQEQIAAAPKGR